MYDTTIYLLNQLINEAVCHGGDSGGAYWQNKNSLVDSINTLLKSMDMDKEYEAVFIKDMIENYSNLKKCFTSVYIKNKSIWTNVLILPKDRSQFSTDDNDFENIF